MNITAKKSLISIALLTLSMSSIAADTLFTLKNLERERAALISDLLDTKADPEQRHAKIVLKQRQLTDIERMVMRDERLVQSNSKLVKKAFASYDLTFLVHAGAEHKRSATQQWLASVNFTNDSILNSKAGYR